MPNNIIEFDEVNFLIQSVSEEINRANLFMFTKTLFQKNHLPFHKDFKIIYSFMHYSKEYFILYYKSKNIQTLEFEYFKEYLDNKSNTLILYKEYFFIFENENFYYYQKINQDIDKSDIEEYISKRFNFKINKTFFIDDENFEKLKDRSNNSLIKLNYLKRVTNLNIFYLLVLFSLISPFILGYYYKYKSEEDYQNKINQLQNKINKKMLVKKEDYLYFKIAKLFKSLDEKNIKILEIDYKDKRINLKIQSLSKENFYTFFKSCKKLFVNRLIYKKKENLYEAELSFLF